MLSHLQYDGLKTKRQTLTVTPEEQASINAEIAQSVASAPIQAELDAIKLADWAEISHSSLGKR